MIPYHPFQLESCHLLDDGVPSLFQLELVYLFAPGIAAGAGDGHFRIDAEAVDDEVAETWHRIVWMGGLVDRAERRRVERL